MKKITLILIALILILTFTACSWQKGEEVVPKDFNELRIGGQLIVKDANGFSEKFTTNNRIITTYVNNFYVYTYPNGTQELKIDHSSLALEEKTETKYRFINNYLEIKHFEKYTIVSTSSIEGEVEVYRAINGEYYGFPVEIDFRQYRVGDSRTYKIQGRDYELYNVDGEEDYLYYGNISISIK